MTYILEFFDTLIAAGYTGEHDAIVEARKDGVAYLRDVLLPNWLGHDTWGRNYWDWPCGVQVETTTEYACRYLMDHPDEFPNWRNDVRNIVTLFTHRTCAAPNSAGDTFSGAWAYPESSACCDRSLWYAPFEMVQVYAQYAALIWDRLPGGRSGQRDAIPSDRQDAGLTQDQAAWAREMARRQLILATYDFLPTGVVEDGIDGGPVVAGSWFKIAHPMALKHCLTAIAWMPEVFAPPGENHIVRSTRTVTSIAYGPERISYTVRARPDAKEPMVDVLRLASTPRAVNGVDLKHTVAMLPDGGCIVTIRHRGSSPVTIELSPPNRAAEVPQLWGAGGGPTGPQRWIFGYSGREDYVDASGNAWRPATEWVIRSGDQTDTVPAAWYTQRRQLAILGTNDPELYRYGAHGKEFWADFTVGPGTYHARLKFCEIRNLEPRARAITVLINGEEVVSGLDIAATAAATADAAVQSSKLQGKAVQAGMGRAVDLVFNGIRPKYGLVSIRFKGTYGGEAIVQSIEVGPGDDAAGAKPVIVGPAPSTQPK